MDIHKYGSRAISATWQVEIDFVIPITGREIGNIGEHPILVRQVGCPGLGIIELG
jgi:hypothetical protein